MLYMFLLYSDAELEAPRDSMNQHLEVVKKAGNAYVCSEALGDTENATTVRIRGGKVAMTDGPFAETKEVLGGFYILDCQDLDEAIEYAAKIPDAQSGAIEVRPILQVPDWPYTVGADRERLAFG